MADVSEERAKQIEAEIAQVAAMSKIADGYDLTEAEKDIMRKCARGEISSKEGYEMIMNLPIPESN